jgi:ribosomal protein S12 methylthiotransferase accessory factor
VRTWSAPGRSGSTVADADLSRGAATAGPPAPVSPDDYCRRLKALAARCGVTRLADVTGLDDIGLPVWQAVRPAGRSLSVHQGKGRTHLDAQIGALSEAIECDCGERLQADGPRARFDDLSPSERGPALSDYARVRELAPPRAKTLWCEATDIVGGGRHYLPHALISLDLTRRREPWFERSSTGMGAGARETDALLTALCELIERDAVGEWERAPPIDRMATELEPGELPFGWFVELRERLRRSGASLRLFAPEAVIPLPAFVCWVEGPERFGRRWRRFGGSGAHPDPETALFRAVAEALQSRLTFIAGVRDDMLPSSYERDRQQSLAALPPLPPGSAGRGWETLPQHDPSAAAIVSSLVAAGYPQVVAKRLDAGLEGIVVLKAFVPGLGSLTRIRRP